jgi:hypothetical protein
MSFQTRIFLAVALCAFILVVFELLSPKPTPEELAAKKAAQEQLQKAEAEAKQPEASEASVDGEPLAESEPAAAAAGPAAEPWDGTLSNDLLALAVTNRSPARGGLVTAAERAPE